MAGTPIGGKNASKTNRERYGEDYYKNIGAIGGSRRSQSKGFAYNTVCNCELIDRQHFIKNCAGVKGGRASVRGKNKEK